MRLGRPFINASREREVGHLEEQTETNPFSERDRQGSDRFRAKLGKQSYPE